MSNATPTTTSSHLTGGCFCGAIRYTAAAVFDAGYCHCTICRRISGGPAACWFSVRAEHFAVTKGEPAALQSSEHFVRFFCAALLRGLAFFSFRCSSWLSLLLLASSSLVSWPPVAGTA